MLFVYVSVYRMFSHQYDARYLGHLFKYYHSSIIGSNGFLNLSYFAQFSEIILTIVCSSISWKSPIHCAKKYTFVRTMIFHNKNILTSHSLLNQAYGQIDYMKRYEKDIFFDKNRKEERTVRLSYVYMRHNYDFHFLLIQRHFLIRVL